MTGRSYNSICYHLIFHTKLNIPYLNDLKFRKQVYNFIKNKCILHDFYLHKIGGTENHVHILIDIPPKVSVSSAVKLIKGSSSYFVNNELPGNKTLYWQEGYGIFTVSPWHKDSIIRYIQNQEKHHKQQLK